MKYNVLVDATYTSSITIEADSQEAAEKLAEEVVNTTTLSFELSKGSIEIANVEPVED